MHSKMEKSESAYLDIFLLVHLDCSTLYSEDIFNIASQQST